MRLGTHKTGDLPFPCLALLLLLSLEKDQTLLFLKLIFLFLLALLARILELKHQMLFCGTNLLIEGLEEAKHKAKNKLLKYCYSIKETDGIALNVLNKVADAKACIQEINEQNKSIPFWRWGLRNYLRKVKRGILQEHIPFSDIGSLFLYLYIKRGIGDSLCFRYDLIRFSRHVSKKKVQNEKNRFSIKNLFRKASLSTIRVINKS